MAGQNCFEDNLVRLNPTGMPSNPEKWNLYEGLRVMAKQMDEIQATQRDLMRGLEVVNQNIATIHAKLR